jgi:hypothetical protein
MFALIHLATLMLQGGILLLLLLLGDAIVSRFGPPCILLQRGKLKNAKVAMKKKISMGVTEGNDLLPLRKELLQIIILKYV